MVYIPELEDITYITHVSMSIERKASGPVIGLHGIIDHVKGVSMVEFYCTIIWLVWH